MTNEARDNKSLGSHLIDFEIFCRKCKTTMLPFKIPDTREWWCLEGLYLTCPNCHKQHSLDVGFRPPQIKQGRTEDLDLP